MAHSPTQKRKSIRKKKTCIKNICDRNHLLKAIQAIMQSCPLHRSNHPAVHQISCKQQSTSNDTGTRHTEISCIYTYIEVSCSI